MVRVGSDVWLCTELWVLVRVFEPARTMMGGSMAHRRPKGLKANRILVAISVLGLDENGYRRTQNEACAVLGMPKSTVSECIRDLLQADYIIESGKSHKDKLYARGPRFCLLESQISDEIRENLRKLKSVRVDSPPITTPDRSDSSDGHSRPVEIAWEVHLPGEMLMFGVEREGSIDRTGIRVTDTESGKERTVWHTIFYGEPYSLNGSTNWSTTFVLPGNGSNNRFVMRYQKTATMKRFYVKPDFEVIVNNETAGSADGLRLAFITACTPLLIWMEKYAGWLFLKDARGMYDLLTKIDVTQVHRALRGELNDVITDVTDGAFVGNGEVWADCSPGYAEMETNAVDYVEAVVDMVETKRKANSAWSELPKVKEDIARLSAEMDELLDISKRLYEISLNIVRTETNTMRVLSRSQTTLDDIVPKSESEEDGTWKFPGSGYL